jgi:general stress protein 26
MSKTLQDLADDMRRLDFAMLATHGPNGTIAARPMSNNSEVDYDGDSWFFADENTRMIDDIERDPQVSLSYQGSSGILSMRPLFIAIEGQAKLVRDRNQFAAHWTKGLERWWPQGIDTPGLVLIQVSGMRAHYWDGNDEGELILEDAAPLE